MTDEQRIRQRMIYVRHYFPGVNLDTISDEEFAMLSEEALWLHEQMPHQPYARSDVIAGEDSLTCRRKLPVCGGLRFIISALAERLFF